MVGSGVGGGCGERGIAIDVEGIKIPKVRTINKLRLVENFTIHFSSRGFYL